MPLSEYAKIIGFFFFVILSKTVLLIFSFLFQVMRQTAITEMHLLIKISSIRHQIDLKTIQSQCHRYKLKIIAAPGRYPGHTGTYRRIFENFRCFLFSKSELIHTTL